MRIDTVCRAAFTAALIIGLSSLEPIAAEPAARSDAALGKVVRGRTIIFAAGYGVEVPISYRADGTMVGRVRAFAALAGGAPRSDRGKWWVSRGSLCQRWRQWLDGKRYCYKLSQRGRTVHWRRNDGRGGTARLVR